MCLLILQLFHVNMLWSYNTELAKHPSFIIASMKPSQNVMGVNKFSLKLEPIQEHLFCGPRICWTFPNFQQLCPLSGKDFQWAHNFKFLDLLCVLIKFLIVICTSDQLNYSGQPNLKKHSCPMSLSHCQNTQKTRWSRF